jgi:PBP1b-binding outer membrane lipoprotein LpoB
MKTLRALSSFGGGGLPPMAVALLALALAGCSSTRQTTQSQSDRQTETAKAVAAKRVSFFQVPFT